MYTNSDLNPQDRQSYLDKLSDGAYSIQSLDGVPILPSAWRTIVKPNSRIKIAFDNPSRSYSRSQSRFQLQDARQSGPGANTARENLAVSIEVLDSVRHSLESEDSINTEDYHDEDTSTSSEEDTPLKPPRSLRLNRYIVPPKDREGNRLSFQVTTKSSSSIITPSGISTSVENKKDLRAKKPDLGGNSLEIRRITKAMMMQSDDQNKLTLYTLPSLAKSSLRTSVVTTWYHIHGSYLDFDRFENVCLTIPHLSDRLQALICEMLTRLRDDKIKPFVGGKFIEPGTVLRADGSDPTDSQSVIFSCVPYFSLQQTVKLSPGQGDLLCPPRTLMQTLYPYESVRERDEEQSYRKFGNDPTKNIIHVPSLWVMNIGSTAIVTYGHESLSVATRDAISIVEEDIRHLGKQDVTENMLANIHVTNLDGSTFIYPIGTFRSYFQLESRIVDLNSVLQGGKGIQLTVQNLDDDTMAGPGNWKSIVTRAAHLVSINIIVSDDQKLLARDETAPNSDPVVVGSPISVPPFFHWMQSKNSDLSQRSGRSLGPDTSEKDRSIACLEYVEKAMTSRYLPHSENLVEDAFTSTLYYHFLPETVYSGVSTRLSELKDHIKKSVPMDSGNINHRMIVSTHWRGVLKQSIQFLETVWKTLKLFVDDLDSSIILRKLSGALQNIHQQVMTIEQRGALEPHSEEYTNPRWEHPDMMKRAWSIRTSAWEVTSSLPGSRKILHRSILRCKRCRNPFQSSTSAITHLRRHVNKYSTGTEHSGDVPSFEELQDWIINSVQYRRELTNATALVILTYASEDATDLFVRARELAEGVQNEDGQMSLLYTLPRELIKAFQKIVIFYLAIERALHENEKAYGQDVRYQDSRRLITAPYSSRDTKVLRRFGGYARRSLCKARVLLCDMAGSKAPQCVPKHLSLGPEYVCLWFIRRLLVTSLEKSKTISDMYHIYVSKVVGTFIPYRKTSEREMCLRPKSSAHTRKCVFTLS